MNFLSFLKDIFRCKRTRLFLAALDTTTPVINLRIGKWDTIVMGGWKTHDDEDSAHALRKFSFQLVGSQKLKKKGDGLDRMKKKFFSWMCVLVLKKKFFGGWVEENRGCVSAGRQPAADCWRGERRRCVCCCWFSGEGWCVNFEGGEWVGRGLGGEPNP